MTRYTDSNVPLPFEGAALGALQDAPCDHSHPELQQLDRNPRFRRISGFHSRYLPDDRDILIYLPTAYLTEPDRRFPVFYLHDGQNLFDGRTSYAPGHTWQAHLTADRLTAEGRIEPVILIGINHTGTRRMAEYTPTRDLRLGGGEGMLYGRLLTGELKPLIDHHLRTLPDAPNTALGGSSLGGLISLALGFAYPSTFGKLAVLSPSLWWDNRSILATIGVPQHSRQKIWLDIGTAEGQQHLHDCDLLHQRLLAHGWHDGLDLQYLRAPNALHNEDAWAARFDSVLTFLFPAHFAA